MDDLQEQYRQELHNQEVKSNMRTLKGFCWIFAGFTLIWLHAGVGFFDVNLKSITMAYGISVCMMLPVTLIYIKGNLSAGWIKYYFLASVSVICGIVMGFLSFHATLVCVVPLLFAIQYRESGVLWFSFWANTITMFLSSFVSFYIGLCDLNLLYKSNYTRDWYLEHMTGNVISLPFNENVPFIIIVYEVFPRVIILMVFAIMLRYTIISSREDALRIADLTYRKETDITTRLFNKNKYEEMAENYYPGLSRVAVIFWDINNLKQTNDKFGHATGDALIETMSSKLYEKTNDRIRAYRVGGDEFLLLIENPVLGESNKVIAEVKESLRSCYEEGGLRVSSAVGFAEGSGAQIRELVKLADERMYQDKFESREGRL